MSFWYAAHIVMYVRRKQKTSAPLPVWENVVLIKAESEQDAWAKAEARGEQEAGDDGGTFRWEGVSAEWVFAGVRKITLCEDPEKRPGDGTEITYVEMNVDSEKDLRGLLAGRPTVLSLDDSTDSAHQPNDTSDRNGVGRKAAKAAR